MCVDRAGNVFCVAGMELVSLEICEGDLSQPEALVLPEADRR